PFGILTGDLPAPYDVVDSAQQVKAATRTARCYKTRLELNTMRDSSKRIAVIHAIVIGFLIRVVGMNGATADLRLIDAVRGQDEQQIRTLLAQRVDVNTRSGDGSTALLWAAHWNLIDAAALLIRAGADANAANEFGMTPLSQACTNGSAAF